MHDGEDKLFQWLEIAAYYNWQKRMETPSASDPNGTLHDWFDAENQLRKTWCNRE